MSIHKECGADITWVPRPDEDGRYYPPLEFLGYVKTVNGDGELVDTAAYRQHLCDPAKIVEWAEYLGAVEEAKAVIGETNIANATYRERADHNRQVTYEAAMEWSCPTCEAPPGSPCEDLGARKKKISKETRWPHPKRMELVDNASKGNPVHPPGQAGNAPGEVRQAAPYVPRWEGDGFR